MVAQTITLPNVRRLFKPDPGRIIFDADLSGADAQIVAAEAADEDLLAAFRSGIKIHAHNAKLMFPSKAKTGFEEPLYSYTKKAVHAYNYGGSPHTVARSLRWSISTATEFRDRWFSLHPAIHAWHNRVENDINQTRSISNVFGYRRIFFDRIEGLLPEALAWVPQSTIALITRKAMVRLEEMVPEVDLLNQVHDSLVGQYPLSLHPGILPRIKEAITIPIPYPSAPLIIPWSIAISHVSWGDCKKVEWETGKEVA